MAAGCDAGTPDEEPLDLPAVHVTRVQAATALDGKGNLVFTTIYPAPPGGAPPILSTTSLRIETDRLLLPDTAVRQSACLQPILGNVPSGSACGDGVLLRPSYDPVLRTLTYRQQAGDPGTPLLPANPYELSLYSASSTSPAGILSFDGIPLAATFHLDLTILADPKGVTLPYDLPPTNDHYCTAPDPTCSTEPCARRVADIFSGNGCSFGGCHGVEMIPDAGPQVQPAEGLQLATPAFLLATAIDHVAHETETGENASTGDPTGSGLRFGRAMPILASSGPADSYLVYKLLAYQGLPLQDPFPPDPTDPTAPAPEIVRLQNELVVGMPMPPIAGPPGVNLLPGEAEWLSAWILQGMPMPATRCPD